MKTKILLGLIGITVVFNVLVWESVLTREENPVLTVSFFNVGQGDAIFIEAPNGNQMLVDAGRNRQILHELSDSMSFFDRSIDVVVVTHTHADHLGGMLPVLSRYHVGTAFISGAPLEASLDDHFHAKFAKQGGKFIPALDRMIIDLGSGVVFEIIAPFFDSMEGVPPNRSSIVGKLTYGKTSFLLTGDAPEDVEKYLSFRYGDLLESDVLKAGHHGSKTSTSEIFLSAVDPEYTIISAGIPNDYGHPDPEVVARIKASGSRVLHTVKSDGVVFQSDGIHLWRKS